MILKLWRIQNLFLGGKMLILKSFATSKMVYVALLTSGSKSNVKEIRNQTLQINSRNRRVNIILISIDKYID